MKLEHGIRLGRKRVPPLAVPGEIFEVYQPHMGPKATLLWLNLRWLVHTETFGDIERILQELTGFSFPELTEGLSILVEYGLLEIAETGEYVVNEPLSPEGFVQTYGTPPIPAAAPESAASMEPDPGGTTIIEPPAAVDSEPSIAIVAADSVATASSQSADTTPSDIGPTPKQEDPTSVEQVASPLSRRNRRRLHADLPPPAAGTPTPIKDARPDIKPRRTESENRSADMEAVVQIYHKKIGMLGPTQFEKLRFWVEDQGMEGEVVALAIEETLQSAQNPRIQYLEGILRNWHNDGILTLQDLLKQKRASKVLSGGESSGGTMEGVPNAAAYRRVDPEMVKKWKELYPDEYDG